MQGRTLAAMCLGTFMAILDTSLINLGLHAIQRELQADMSVLQWVVDLYNLAYAALILTGGTLADLYGRRLIFLTGTVIFAVGSLVCAIAPDAGMLIAGRGIAGIGAALLLPAALAILNVAYPDPHQRTRAIAIWGGVNGLAMAIGPTLGGLLIDSLGWRSLFYVILPVAAATFALARVAVAESSDPKGRRLDITDQSAAALTLGALCLAVIEGPTWGWASPATLACFAASALGAVWFVVGASRSQSPLVPLSIFSNRAFSAAVLDAGMMTFGMYGLLFVLPLYLQAVIGHSAARAGIELLPMSATFFVVSLVAGRIANAVGGRAVIAAGMTMNAIGLAGLALFATRFGYGAIAPALFVIGVGLGIITGPIASAAVANAPVQRSGMSSGLVNVGRMVGATLGVAILGVIFGARSEAVTQDAVHFAAGMQLAFLVGAAAGLAGALIALMLMRADSLAPQKSAGAPGLFTAEARSAARR